MEQIIDRYNSHSKTLQRAEPSQLDLQVSWKYFHLYYKREMQQLYVMLMIDIPSHITQLSRKN